MLGIVFCKTFSLVNHICPYFLVNASICWYLTVNATGMANVLICRHFANLGLITFLIQFNLIHYNVLIVTLNMLNPDMASYKKKNNVNPDQL